MRRLVSLSGIVAIGSVSIFYLTNAGVSDALGQPEIRLTNMLSGQFGPWIPHPDDNDIGPNVRMDWCQDPKTIPFSNWAGADPNLQGVVLVYDGKWQLTGPGSMCTRGPFDYKNKSVSVSKGQDVKYCKFRTPPGACNTRLEISNVRVTERLVIDQQAQPPETPHPRSTSHWDNGPGPKCPQC